MNNQRMFETLKKIMKMKCYSSEKLIAQNIHYEVVPPGSHLTAESTEAM